VSLYEDVREDEASSVGSVKRIGPGIIDKIAKLCKDYWILNSTQMQYIDEAY